MTRFFLAAALAAAFGAPADAQPPTLPPVPPLPLPPAAPLYAPRPTAPILNPPRYTAWPVVVNGVRYYPFDSGEYALGGFDGLGRTQGYFAMGPPTGDPDAMDGIQTPGPLLPHLGCVQKIGCTLRIGSFRR